MAALDDLLLALPPPTLRARAIAVGATHACVLALDGDVRCWGAEDRLGGASAAAPGIPVTVPGLRDVVEIDVGLAHTAARTRSGDVLSWGGGDLGEIGDGSPLHRLAPTRALVTGARALVVSHTATCVRLDDGELRCWGSLPSSADGSLVTTPTPTHLDVAVADTLDVDVDAGSRAVALGPDGVVWQWGSVPTLGLAAAPRTGPVRVAPLGPARELASGQSFSCAALDDGVSCWGTGRYHFFGGTSDEPNVPERLAGMPRAAQLVAGDGFLCAAAEGETWCAGWGELVDPSGGIWPLTHTPSRVAPLDGVDELDAGLHTVCGLSGGAVRCVGWRDGIAVDMPPS